MIVPSHDPGVRRVRGAQVGIAFVLSVAGAVLVQRLRHAAQVRAHHITGVAAFVNVVTHKQHQVQVLLRDLAVRGENPLLKMLAGGQHHAQRRHFVLRRRGGAGAAHRAGGRAAGETVPIVARGLQALGLQVHAHAALRRGHRRPLPHAFAQGLIGKHLAKYRQRPRFMGRVSVLHQQAGPQHHAVGARLATGHTQRKRVVLPAQGALRIGGRAQGLLRRQAPGRQGQTEGGAAPVTAIQDGQR